MDAYRGSRRLLNFFPEKKESEQRSMPRPSPGADTVFSYASLATPIDLDRLGLSYMFAKGQARKNLVDYVARWKPATKEQLLARKFILGVLPSEDENEALQTEWLKDFLTWGLGLPRKYDDAINTYYLKDFATGKERWDRYKHSIFSARPNECSEFVKFFLELRARFLKQLEILRLEGPTGHTAKDQLTQAFLYFKYIVRGVPAHREFLADLDKLFPDDGDEPASGVLPPSGGEAPLGGEPGGEQPSNEGPPGGQPPRVPYQPPSGGPQFPGSGGSITGIVMGGDVSMPKVEEKLDQLVTKIDSGFGNVKLSGDVSMPKVEQKLDQLVTKIDSGFDKVVQALQGQTHVLNFPADFWDLLRTNVSAALAEKKMTLDQNDITRLGEVLSREIARIGHARAARLPAGSSGASPRPGDSSGAQPPPPPPPATGALTVQEKKEIVDLLKDVVLNQKTAIQTLETVAKKFNNPDLEPLFDTLTKEITKQGTAIVTKLGQIKNQDGLKQLVDTLKNMDKKIADIDKNVQQRFSVKLTEEEHAALRTLFSSELTAISGNVDTILAKAKSIDQLKTDLTYLATEHTAAMEDLRNIKTSVDLVMQNIPIDFNRLASGIADIWNQEVQVLNQIYVAIKGNTAPSVQEAQDFVQRANATVIGLQNQIYQANSSSLITTAQKDELTRQLAAVQEELAKTAALNSDLEAKLLAAQRESETMRGQVENANALATRTSVTLREKDTEIEERRKSLAEYGTTITDLERRLTSAGAKYNELQKKAEQTIALYEQDVTLKDQKIADLVEQIQNLTETVKEKSRQAQEFDRTTTTTADEAKRQIETLIAQKTKLADEYEVRIKTLTDDLNSKTREKENYETEIARTRGELEKTQDLLKHDTGKAVGDQAKIRLLSDQVEDLRKQLATAETNLQASSGEVQKTQKNLTTLKDMNFDAREEIGKLNVELKTKDNEVAAAKSRIAKLEAEQAAALEEIRMLQRNLKRKLEQVSAEPPSSIADEARHVKKRVRFAKRSEEELEEAARTTRGMSEKRAHNPMSYAGLQVPEGRKTRWTLNRARARRTPRARDLIQQVELLNAGETEKEFVADELAEEEQSGRPTRTAQEILDAFRARLQRPKPAIRDVIELSADAQAKMAANMRLEPAEELVATEAVRTIDEPLEEAIVRGVQKMDSGDAAKLVKKLENTAPRFSEEKTTANMKRMLETTMNVITSRDYQFEDAEHVINNFLLPLARQYHIKLETPHGQGSSMGMSY